MSFFVTALVYMEKL